jgi:hypothetical protein
MMVSASGVYITMLTGRRDNPDRCIVARDEYTARAQVIVCTSSIPVSRTKRHRRQSLFSRVVVGRCCQWRCQWLLRAHGY